MANILHIARIRTAATERRVAAMTSDSGFVFHLVRPSSRTGRGDRGAIHESSRLGRVRFVRMWRESDPHRGLYLTTTFGVRDAMPDIIHAEEEPDSLAALHVAACRRLLAPRARLVLFTWQNVDRPTRRAVHGVMRRTLAAADAVICGSRGAVARLRGLGFSRPTPVIPALALDASVFHPRPVPRSSDSFTVAFVGRLVPEKGIDTLLESVAAIGRPATLVVAGSGPCRAALERRAQALGIGGSVRFVGALEEAGVADVLNGADVLAVPSRSTPVWREQFGRVIVEAMGCGVPVVGSDCGAIPEVIGSSGFVFPEGDSGALADHLRRLRSSPQLRQEFGRRGRDWALASHDLSLRARQILDFYRELGRESPGGAR